jgi:excinuclease ABC subunit A
MSGPGAPSFAEKRRLLQLETLYDLALTLPAEHDERELLDEPTTCRHFDDVRNLFQLLQRLVELGSTMIVVEHNLDVIKTADWVIDLGPDGGGAGGRLVAEGPPEKVAKAAASHTGRYLARVLEPHPKPRVA